MFGFLGFVTRRAHRTRRGDVIRRLLMLQRPGNAHDGDLGRKAVRY